MFYVLTLFMIESIFYLLAVKYHGNKLINTKFIFRSLYTYRFIKLVTVLVV